jgi:hypothetical protein
MVRWYYESPLLHWSLHLINIELFDKPGVGAEPTIRRRQVADRTTKPGTHLHRGLALRRRSSSSKMGAREMLACQRAHEQT